MSRRRYRYAAVGRAAALLSLVVVLQRPAHALDVFLDFTANIGNGAGGPANTTADWIDNLNAIATSAGIAAFTPAERAGMQAGIKSKLQAMYTAYSVAFAETQPGSTHERINFGAYSSSAGTLGVAPLDFLNLFDSNGTEGRSARVFSNNFASIIESFEPRATIIAELTTALAGTAGHELGHSLGAQHHHSYGDPAITPSDYGNTGGIQNTHIMATGGTGLNEIGRETARTFSPWENLMLEAAGGGIAAIHGLAGVPLAATVLAETNSHSGADVGGTTGTAKSLSLMPMPISGLDAANTVSSLASDADVDVFTFTVAGESRLLADVWSANAYADNFDPILRLLAPDGVTVLAEIDDTRYAGNLFNGGTTQSFDSSLLNILLPAAGAYYLEVCAFGNISGNPGGNYSLIFGVAAVPEPGSIALAAIAACAISVVSRRRARRWFRADE